MNFHINVVLLFQYFKIQIDPSAILSLLNPPDILFSARYWLRHGYPADLFDLDHNGEVRGNF